MFTKAAQSLRLHVSPFFIIRYYMYQDIKKILESYKFEGKILDVGCGQKPFRDLFSSCQRYIGIDFKNYSVNKDFTRTTPDIYFSKDYIRSLALPFKSESFDNCVSFQVMEHHRNPEKMINEMLRVTKKHGYILITVPFLFGVHEEPNDYQRYTKYGLTKLFQNNNCRVIEIKSEGSLASTISMLLNGYINYWASKNKFLYILCLFVYLPFLFLQYLSLFLDKFIKSEQIVLNYLVVAQKR